MKNNKKAMTLVEMMFVVLISSVILVFWFNSGYRFYQNIEEKTISNQVRDKINDVITANDVWRWIEKIRIKTNTLIFRNNSNFIENYYYTEVYEIDPITQIRSSIPKIEFYWMEEVVFPDQVSFSYPNQIQWVPLTLDIWTEQSYLWIRRIMPNNDIIWFDANPIYFQYIPNVAKRTFRSDFTFWKWFKTLIMGDEVDEVNYYDILNTSIPPEFLNIEIQVLFRWKHIWDIVLDKELKRLNYVDKRSEEI